MHYHDVYVVKWKTFPLPSIRKFADCIYIWISVESWKIIEINFPPDGFCSLCGSLFHPIDTLLCIPKRTVKDPLLRVRSVAQNLFHFSSWVVFSSRLIHLSNLREILHRATSSALNFDVSRMCSKHEAFHSVISVVYVIKMLMKS